jgi:hypothetical protein
MWNHSTYSLIQVTISSCPLSDTVHQRRNLQRRALRITSMQSQWPVMRFRSPRTLLHWILLCFHSFPRLLWPLLGESKHRCRGIGFYGPTFSLDSRCSRPMHILMTQKIILVKSYFKLRLVRLMGSHHRSITRHIISRFPFLQRGQAQSVPGLVYCVRPIHPQNDPNTG